MFFGKLKYDEYIYRQIMQQYKRFIKSINVGIFVVFIMIALISTVLAASTFPLTFPLTFGESDTSYTITLAQGYNMIGWTSATPKTSSELCSIVPNCTYVYKKNPDGSWTTKQCGYPGGNFDVSRGFSFLAYITEECDWTRDE